MEIELDKLLSSDAFIASVERFGAVGRSSPDVVPTTTEAAAMEQVTLDAQAAIGRTARVLEDQISRILPTLAGEGASLPEDAPALIRAGSAVLFEVWRRTHPDLDERDLLQSFENWILRGAADGAVHVAARFAEARNRQKSDQAPELLLASAVRSVSLRDFILPFVRRGTQEKTLSYADQRCPKCKRKTADTSKVKACRLR